MGTNRNKEAITQKIKTYANREKFGKLKRVKAAVDDELMGKKNVFSIGVGFKYVNGKKTDDICISCGVTEKVDKSELFKSDLIPNKIQGIPTDVTLGEIPVALSDPKALYRPSPGGVSVGVEGGGTAGTISCALRHAPSGSIFGLSNAHVIPYLCGIANDNGARCENFNWVWQPSAYDGGQQADNPMGYLFRYGSIDKNHKLYADWAIFSSPHMERHKILDITLPYGLHYTADDVFPDDAVVKSGRTTGVTTGTVVETGVTICINYTNCAGDAYMFILYNQIKTTSMLSGGDSGSLLLHNRSDKQVVGLCFASGGSYSYANDFSHVLNEVNGAPPPKDLYTYTVQGTGNPANAYKSFSPVNCTGLTKENGTLQIDLWANNPGILTNQGRIEISSSGHSDENEWAVLVPHTEITTGRQTFRISLANAVTTGGELDVNAINYIRWYNYTTGASISISFDNVVVVQSRPYNINF